MIDSTGALRAEELWKIVAGGGCQVGRGTGVAWPGRLQSLIDFFCPTWLESRNQFSAYMPDPHRDEEQHDTTHHGRDGSESKGTRVSAEKREPYAERDTGEQSTHERQD